MRLSPQMSWENALDALTALPGDLQEKYGEVNFMRAGHFRRNGRCLYEKAILPLLKEAGELELVLGFVDAVIATEAGLGPDDGCLPGSDRFLAARLLDPKTGEILDVLGTEFAGEEQ